MAFHLLNSPGGPGLGFNMGAKSPALGPNSQGLWAKVNPLQSQCSIYIIDDSLMLKPDQGS